MKHLALALTLLVPLALVIPAPLPAAAETSCSSRDKVLDHLSHKYSETPVAVGVANNGGVIEVLSSLDGQTWTIIITMPDGMSCMVAAGEAWDLLPQVAHRPKT